MSEPTIKKPTKKTFHFPKAAENAPAEKKKAVASAPAVEESKKVEEPKKAVTVEKAATVKKAASAEKAATVKKAASVEKAATVKKAAKKVETGPTIRKAVKPSPVVKAKRAKKDKVVRDSFTMPKSDYEKIAALKLKCQEAGVSIKKSELLRAGLLMLEAASPKRLLAAVSAVEQVKTGRPAKS